MHYVNQGADSILNGTARQIDLFWGGGYVTCSTSILRGRVTQNSLRKPGPGGRMRKARGSGRHWQDHNGWTGIAIGIAMFKCTLLYNSAAPALFLTVRRLPILAPFS